ncbi:SBBP repeat-containing protein, partial [Acidobacteriota bacterium]
MKKNVVKIFVVFVLFGLLIGAKDWKAPSQRNGETEASFAVQPWFGQPEEALRTRAEQTGETAEMLQFTSGAHVLGFKQGAAVMAAGNYALKIEFLNARPVAPVERGLWDSSLGNKSKPLSEVIYNGLWENVDLVYESHDSGVVKSTYFIQPGEDGVSKAVESIRLGYNVPVQIKENGALMMSFDQGWMEESPPVAWQEIDGQRHPVEVTYKIKGERELGFNVGEHDERYPLVIDPVLSWETSVIGRTYCIAVDTSGNVYVSGLDSGDLFVAKLDTNGGVTWNISMGAGQVWDGGYNIVVDASGNVYVVGIGSGTWGTPVNAYTGGDEAFAAKLNSSGVLQWHTFMGSAPVEVVGSDPIEYTGGIDIGTGIAVDTSGNVYVTGYSDTTWGATPLNAHAGGEEIFVTKLDSAGAQLWNTFLGSASGDRAFGLALDTSGDVYVTGRSAATWGSPVNSHAGSWDIFAAKVNASGALQWNTFLGSGNNDYSFGIAVDSSGNVHLAGRSSSTWGTPVNAFSGILDAFAAKLNSSGALVWNTFMGSATGDDRGFGLALDAGGNVYVAGYSDVTWGSPKNAFNASNDAFAAKLNPSGALLWNTFYGSEFGDYGYGAGVDTLGNVFLSWYSGTEAFVTKIDPKDLTVTAPNGAESWLVGTVQNITWTVVGTVGPVKIEYSTDNGVTWTDIIATTANTGTYPWTIPDFPSAQCYVRVSEVADPLLFDTNDAVFIIWPLPNLVVNSPNGAETWEVGSVQNIVWTPIGTVGPVKIEYSINSGAAWTDIIASTANTGTYPWTIPNSPSDQCVVRISEAADGIPVDTSDLLFSIVPESSITLTSPNGGESWDVASAQNITWTTLGIVGAVKIEYSVDSGATWTEIVASTANTGTYPWTIPNTPSAQCVVRISEAADGSTVDTSDAVFSIPAITLTSPNGGESWVGGSAQNITWTSVGTVGPVKIEYSINNGAAWTDIIASTANTGTYPWTVSNTPATVCLIRIREAADGSPVDTSDAVFTILAQPEITITSPNGGESWEGGSAHNITWTTAGTVGPVKIEYSTDNGVAWTDIIASTANTGTYPWSVLNTPSTECLVRISEADDSIPVDTSDAVFTIVALPEISLTSPNGGESWETGSSQNITWTTVGTVGDVKIEYSTDNGVAWTEVVNPSPNDGTHPWTIPGTTSAQCLVRISEAADGSPIDSSDAVFSIVPAPAVSMTSPNGGESWDGGSAQNITWTSEGTVGAVKIEYSTDSGTSWTEVVATTPNDGTHPWTVPNTPSTQCLVRIGEAADGSPSDTSDAVFSILFQPQISITSPNGGESWEVGSANNITWTTEGTVGPVKIEYSTDSGTSWTEVVATTPNDGTHPWTVPNSQSVQCLVRIGEASDGSPVDNSDAIFSIVPVPAITVTSPNGGENWVVGSAHNITWTSEGTVGDVKIEYSTDNGTAWTEIVNPTANDGTHPWTVPSTMSVMCLVRISEAADGNPVDTSDGVFSITAISLTFPNGGESWETGSLQNITWSTAGAVGDVKIEYSTDNGTAWTVIVNPTANDGIHPWSVPNTPSSQCLVRISEASDGSPMDTSDAVFTIKVTIP